MSRAHALTTEKMNRECLFRLYLKSNTFNGLISEWNWPSWKTGRPSPLTQRFLSAPRCYEGSFRDIFITRGAFGCNCCVNHSSGSAGQDKFGCDLGKRKMMEKNSHFFVFTLKVFASYVNHFDYLISSDYLHFIKFVFLQKFPYQQKMLSINFKPFDSMILTFPSQARNNKRFSKSQIRV